MALRLKQVELPADVDDEVQREAERLGKTWSETASELLDEAVKMRRVSGIVFTDGHAGRRATIAGSGLDVWEFIRTWCDDVDRNYEELRQVHRWLTERQLRAALAYYNLYPDEIDERLRVEESWTLERVYRELPFTRPPWHE